jgi:hypothetical protein
MEANLARADDRIVEINVAYWLHETDMPTLLVRSRGQSGKHLLAFSFSGFDPSRTLGRGVWGRLLVHSYLPLGRKMIGF